MAIITHKKKSKFLLAFLSPLSSLSPTSRNPLFLTLFSPDLLFSGKLPDRRRASSQARVPTTLAYPWFDGLRCRAASNQPCEPSCPSWPGVAPVTSPPPPTSSSSRSARGATRRADRRRGVFKEPWTKTTTSIFLHLLRAPPSFHGGAANHLGWLLWAWEKPNPASNQLKSPWVWMGNFQV